MGDHGNVSELWILYQADFEGNNLRPLTTLRPHIRNRSTMSGPTPQQAEDLFTKIEEKFPHNVAEESWYLVVVGSLSSCNLV